VIDFQKKKQIDSWKAHQGFVNALLLHQDKIWSCGNDKIRVWDTKTRQPLADLTSHKGRILCLAPITYTDGQQHIWSGSFDKSILVWDPKTFKRVQVLKGHDDDVHCLVDIGSDMMCSGGRDWSIIFWYYRAAPIGIEEIKSIIKKGKGKKAASNEDQNLDSDNLDYLSTLMSKEQNQIASENQNKNSNNPPLPQVTGKPPTKTENQLPSASSILEKSSPNDKKNESSPTSLKKEERTEDITNKKTENIQSLNKSNAKTDSSPNTEIIQENEETEGLKQEIIDLRSQISLLKENIDEIGYKDPEIHINDKNPSNLNNIIAQSQNRETNTEKKSPDSKHALKDLTDPEKQTVAGNKIPLKSEIDSPLQKQEKPFTMPNQTEIQLHERENKSPNLDEQRLEESAKKLNLIKTTISILTDKIQLHFQELIQQITKITIVDKLIPLVDKMKSVRSELLSAEELVPFEKVEKTRPSMQDGKLKFAIDVLSYEIQKNY